MVNRSPSTVTGFAPRTDLSIDNYRHPGYYDCLHRLGREAPFTPQGWEDYDHWQRTDRTLIKRINRLLDDALRDPTGGIGKPEPLKYGIAGPGRGALPRSIGSSIRCSARISTCCRPATTARSEGCRRAVSRRFRSRACTGSPTRTSRRAEGPPCGSWLVSRAWMVDDG